MWDIKGFSAENKEGITIASAFKIFLDESRHQTNKIWVDQGSEFYKRLVKSKLHGNDIEMYLTHNEGKYVVAERFIRNLKTRFQAKVYDCGIKECAYQ